jgi:hypothetical protein
MQAELHLAHDVSCVHRAIGQEFYRECSEESLQDALKSPAQL